MIQLSFHGAARTVTGSKYLVTVNDDRLLIDCGAFQGRRALRQLNWANPQFDPATVNAAIATHAHIDHIGYFPRLQRLGFKGPVFASAPTCDLARVSLIDAAHIQEEDAAYRNRKKLTRHKKALPLFTAKDAEAVLRSFESTPYYQWKRITKSIRFRLHVVGHILGAAAVEVELADGPRKVSILFSGDVGRYGNPLTINPSEPPECDYLVCESTYGDRIHKPEDAFYQFEQLINKAHEDKSILLIPAFAVSRTQQVTYLITRLIESGRVKPIDIHIDSPMAISATDVYCKYHSYHSVDIKQIGGDKCVLEGKNIHFHRKRKSSKTLNKLKGPAIIISASGMLSGGRILHHLINRLPDPRTTLVLVGFMAEGTLGRRLVEGERSIYIHKQLVEVKANIVSMYGLSGHADWYELMHWLEPIKKKPSKVFITHGELSQSEAMAARLSKERGWDCLIPDLDQTVTL